jgi:hypothetical protein
MEVCGHELNGLLIQPAQQIPTGGAGTISQTKPIIDMAFVSNIKIKPSKGTFSYICSFVVLAGMESHSP